MQKMLQAAPGWRVLRRFLHFEKFAVFREAVAEATLNWLVYFYIDF